MEMQCSSCASCKHSMKSNRKPDNSVGMDKKRKDLIATPKFKKVMQEYGNGTLKSSSGADVNSPQQAKAIAASESGQSYNQHQKDRGKADRFGMRNRGKK